MFVGRLNPIEMSDLWPLDILIHTGATTLILISDAKHDSPIAIFAIQKEVSHTDFIVLCFVVFRCTDGRTDGWTDKWTDGWKKRLFDGRKKR